MPRWSLPFALLLAACSSPPLPSLQPSAPITLTLPVQVTTAAERQVSQAAMLGPLTAANVSKVVVTIAESWKMWDTTSYTLEPYDPGATITLTNLARGHRYALVARAFGVNPQTGASEDLTSPDVPASQSFLNVPENPVDPQTHLVTQALVPTADRLDPITRVFVPGNHLLDDAATPPRALDKLPLHLKDLSYNGQASLGVDVIPGGFRDGGSLRREAVGASLRR